MTKAKPDGAAQFGKQGYLLTESQQLGLVEMVKAMESISLAYDMDEQGSGCIDLAGPDVAVIFRSFSRLGAYLMFDAPFVEARARHPYDSVKA